MNHEFIKHADFLPACVWCFHRKLLHQVVEGKEVSQEENFLPKRQRVKDLCQRAEYQTPCQQTGQVVQHFTSDTFTPSTPDPTSPNGITFLLHPCTTIV